MEKLVYLLDVVLHGDAAECDGENAGHVEYLSCDNPFVLDILRFLALLWIRNDLVMIRIPLFSGHSASGSVPKTGPNRQILSVQQDF